MAGSDLEFLGVNMEEEEWDWKEKSRYFLAQAAEQQRRLWELQPQAKCDPIRPEEYDRTVAAFSVYHYLWGKPFLLTQKGLIEELQAILNCPTPAERPYNQPRFVKYWKEIIGELSENLELRR